MLSKTRAAQYPPVRPNEYKIHPHAPVYRLFFFVMKKTHQYVSTKRLTRSYLRQSRMRTGGAFSATTIYRAVRCSPPQDIKSSFAVSLKSTFVYIRFERTRATIDPHESAKIRVAYISIWLLYYYAIERRTRTVKQTLLCLYLLPERQRLATPLFEENKRFEQRPTTSTYLLAYLL